MILQLLMPTALCLIIAVWSLLHKCIDVIDDFATTDANGIVCGHSCLKFTAQMHWCYWWFCNYWCQRHRVWSQLFEVYCTNALVLLMILQLLMPTASCLITAVWSLLHKCIDVIDDFATTDANGIVSDHSCLKFTAQMHWCYWWFCNYWCQRHCVWSQLFEVYCTNALMLLMILQLLMPTTLCLIIAVWSLPHKCIDVIDDFATTDANGIVCDHSCLKFTAQMHWCYWWFCNYWCQRHRVWS